MTARIVPLVLLLACAPSALAFPPCPRAPLEIEPLGGTPSQNSSLSSRGGGTPLWFKATYGLVGNPVILRSIGNGPGSGLCTARDQVPVPEPNESKGLILLNPSYAPSGGFGIVALPELPAIATDGLRIAYHLSFSVDNAPLDAQGDWLDVMQLDFLRSGASAPAPLSTVYRVRKTQMSRDTVTLAVIESRDTRDDITQKQTAFDHVVASIALPGDADTIPVALRWTQHATALPDSTDRAFRIDSLLEVIGPEGVLYTVALPDTWASSLSMGLLDYNIATLKQSTQTGMLHLDDMSLFTIQYPAGGD